MLTKATSILDKKSYTQLKSTDNLIATLDLLIRVAINFILAYFVLTISESNYLLLIFVWYLYSLQFQFWGYAGLGHEAFHNNVFSSKLINKYLFEFCSALTWNNSAMFAKTHWLHHKKTFSENDHEATSEQNWETRHIIAYALIDFRSMYRKLLYTLTNSLGYYPNLTPIENRFRVAAFKNLSFNIILYLAIFVISNNPVGTMLLILAPFTASLLNKVLAKAQHHQLDVYRNEGALKFSRTIHLPRPISFLYANMNFHAEHHFAPSIPYYKLPKLHKILANKGLISSVSLTDFLTGWRKRPNPDTEKISQ
ncbi:MAG: fatty acid desaturase [Gammaproteobacteria bacterium]|nr:fatty acid desaturase [Gammaproteobacteria bacterium]